MRKLITAAVLGVFAWAALGCMAEATPDEIQKMCENLARLNGTDQVPTKEALVADVDAMFSQLEKDVKAARDEQVKLWESDLKAQLAASKDEAQKASLMTLMDQRKKQAEEKMQLDLASFAPRRAEEMEKVDKTIKAAQEELATAIKKCVEKAAAEKITQELALCRTNAKTLDKYNQVCY